MIVNFTPEYVLGIVLAILSLAFDYFPFLAAWFDKLFVPTKRLIMLGLAFVVTLVLIVGACRYGWFTTAESCMQINIVQITYNLVLAVAIMYGFHQTTKPSARTKTRLGITK